MKPLRIYVAHRYSCHGKYLETFASIGRAVKVGIEIAKLGHYPFVPHTDVLLAIMSNGELPLKYYYNASLEWLKVSNAIFIFDTADIMNSEGVRTEYLYALKYGIPVYTKLEDIPQC